MAKNEREDKLYEYDPNTDYQALIDSAVEAQDFSAAAKYEQQRNEKIRGEGITQYQPTYNYTRYLPSYGDQMDAIMEQIFNRQPFEYDMDADALYQQYKDRYITQGKLAMEDAMGKAAQLTGGYGNSYAQSVGQQTFQGYMDGLNDKVPELYALARSKYDAEGNELLSRYSLLADRENTEYNRETAESQQAYSLALSMLQSGIMPSQGVLESSGISQEDAQAIYDQANSGGQGGYIPDTDPDEDDPQYGPGIAQGHLDNLMSMLDYAYKSGNAENLEQYLSEYSMRVSEWQWNNVVAPWLDENNIMAWLNTHST